MKNSKLFKLNLNDFTKGLVVVLLTAVVSTLYQAYISVPPKVDWNLVLNNSILAGLGYILKQVGTNSQGKILKKDKNAK
jgi:hypothetical protein